MDQLTSEEKQLILESLRYTKLKFESYEGYPSTEFKQKRVNEVNNLIMKLKAIFKIGH